MINTVKECREFKKFLKDREKSGREEEVMESIVTLRRSGEIGNNISFRNLFGELVDDGWEAIREMESRNRGGNSRIMEAGGDAIDTSRFSSIIGQVTFADLLQNFENPMFIGGDLVTEIPATTAQQEQIPGVTPLGDEADFVGENEEYPIVGYGEQYIMLPEILKNGFIMNITEEVIFEDKTGLFLANFGKTLESMAITQEKERLSTALGITNTYSRNGGPRQNTYGNTHTQGDFDNLIASNPLVDHTSFAAAKNAFVDLIDPDTGEPIVLGSAYQVVVPDQLEWQLGTILQTSKIETQPARGSTAIKSTTVNPMFFGNRTYTPLSNPWVSSITGSDSTWFIGNFKKAFVERVIYQPQVQTQDRTSDLSFSRDIVSRVKVRKRTRCGVKEPRYVQKHTAG